MEFWVLARRMSAVTPPASSKRGPVDTVAAAADRTSLLRTIDALERQRDMLGGPAIDLALGPLRSRLAALDAGASPRDLAERTSERKVVTVLFVDIAGFTQMSEQGGSEAMLEIVNGLFDRLVPVIERYGGVIDKFIGDEIMAVFGAPRAVEHHAEHALRAALDIFTALADYNCERGLELGLHIGANTGPVIAGAVGSRARHDYSVTGDTVNVAARLEGAAETGQILVGPSTFRHTVQLFEFEALEPLALKGKMRPLDVYRLPRRNAARGALARRRSAAPVLRTRGRTGFAAGAGRLRWHFGTRRRRHCRRTRRWQEPARGGISRSTAWRYPLARGECARIPQRSELRCHAGAA